MAIKVNLFLIFILYLKNVISKVLYNLIMHEQLSKGIKLFLSTDENFEYDLNSEFGRNKSWDILNKLTIEYFNNRNKIDYDIYTMNLSLYLASWGMYRGSTKLLQRYNYKILTNISKIVLNEKYKKLLNLFSIDNYTTEVIDLIVELYSEIENELESLFKKSSPLLMKRNDEIVELKTSGVTPTLITKIMLGSFGCTVAYDTYIQSCLRKINLKTRNVSNLNNFNKSLIEIVEWLKEISFSPTFPNEKKYPIMKALDMGMFVIGKEN